MSSERKERQPRTPFLIRDILNLGADKSPLDALRELTSTTFTKTNDSPKKVPYSQGSQQTIKKKRKSRTAFTNHQIFELEKRFLYQKYLSPADRDELAHALGLSAAQVITWFQNRRAKLKRDLEELQKDVDASHTEEQGSKERKQKSKIQ